MYPRTRSIPIVIGTVKKNNLSRVRVLFTVLWSWNVVYSTRLLTQISFLLKVKAKKPTCWCARARGCASPWSGEDCCCRGRWWGWGSRCCCSSGSWCRTTARTAGQHHPALVLWTETNLSYADKKEKLSSLPINLFAREEKCCLKVHIINRFFRITALPLLGLFRFLRTYGTNI